MRYYLLTIQHNAGKGAENRIVPRAFDGRLDAVGAYHAGSLFQNQSRGRGVSYVHEQQDLFLQGG